MTRSATASAYHCGEDGHFPAIPAILPATATCLAFSLVCFTFSPPAANGDDGNSGVEYSYKENLNRRVYIRRGELYYISKLDAAGNFIPLNHGINIGGTFFGNIEIANNVGPKFAKWPADKGPVPDWSKVKEPVYEYRSGWLIHGWLDLDGNFIPDPAKAITAFKDFIFNPDGDRIYNLPGTFVRKAK